jgi:hypothetical protein
MVVDDLDTGRTGAARRPLETDAPSIVDTDTPLPTAIALQGFEAIAGADQIADIDSGVELIQLARSASLES